MCALAKNSAMYRVAAAVMVGVMAFAIIACSLTAIGHDHCGSATGGAGHVEHARSLTLAIIPLVLAFVAMFLVLAVFPMLFGVAMNVRAVCIASAQDPPWSLLIGYQSHSPRSPPR